MENELYITRNEQIGLLDDLSKKLFAITNLNRLRALVIVANETNKTKNRRNPTDIRGINERLKEVYEESITQVALTNHMKILFEAGLVKKEPGTASRSYKGAKTVCNYLLVPGALKALSMQIDLLNNSIQDIQEEISKSSIFPTVKILGGKDDGKIFDINEKKIRIGRKGDIDPNDSEYINDIVLSNYYKNVSRVFKPHAFFIEKEDEWYVKEGKDAGDIFLNNRKINNEAKLNHDDIIKLAVGDRSVQLVFYNDNLNMIKDE